VSIGEDRTVRIWNIAEAKETKKMGPTADDPYGLAFSKDGKQLATSGYSGLLTLWNVEEGKDAASKKIKFGAYCLVFSPDGQALVTGHDNHMIYITPVAALGK
jgi:WD40 repeat protein